MWMCASENGRLVGRVSTHEGPAQENRPTWVSNSRSLKNDLKPRQQLSLAPQQSLRSWTEPNRIVDPGVFPTTLVDT